MNPIPVPITNTLVITVARMDGETGLPIEPDGGDDPVVSVWKNGVDLTSGSGFTATVGDFVANVGSRLAITLATALVANDNVVAKLDLDYSVEGTRSWFGQWTCTGAATEANATANRAAVIAAVEGVIDHGDGTGEWGATNLGSGSTPWTEVIRTTDGTPIVGASVWITSDLAGTNVVAGTIVTISGGAFPSPFMLDSGETYYLWVSATGYNFPNPTSFTVP